MFKKLFLPVGMLVVLAFSLIYPPCGSWIKQFQLGNVFIILIFLVCGWQTKLSEIKFDRKFLFLFTAGAVVSLGIAPWIASLIAGLLNLQALVMVGLVVISAMPPTLSSGIVMTENAEGNTFLSMMMTIGYNLLGVFTLPVILSWILASRSQVNTDPLNMLGKLFLLVVVPFFAGLILKRLTRMKLPGWVGYVPSTCVLLLLLSFFASSSAQLKSFPVRVLLFAALAGIVMHLILLLGMWFGGRALKYSPFDCKALIFTGASKTLTLALTTLAIMKADSGEAVVPCLIYYFLQMLVDSMIAGKMGLSAKAEKKKAEKEAEQAPAK